MSELDAQQESSKSLSDDFWNWDYFRLSPWRFDEYIVHHWYLFSVAYYFILLLLAIVHDTHALHTNFFSILAHPSYWTSYSWTKYYLTSWINTSLVMAVILTALTFDLWKRSIPVTFQALLDKGRIGCHVQNCDVNKEYVRFLNAYQRTLKSNKRYLFCSITMLVTLVFVLLLEGRYLPPANLLQFDPLNWFVLLSSELVTIGFPVFWAYCFGIGAWAMCVSGWYVKQLTIQFDFTIQPSHPDNCGGLRLLGRFCLGMALPILIGATLLGVYGIGLAINIGIHLFSIAANVGLVLFALPLAAIAFWAPLWNIHRKMVSEKEAYEDRFADRVEEQEKRVAELEKRIPTLLDEGKLEEAKAFREKMEILQALHHDKISYPIWPFDRSILLRFLTPQIVPVISLIVGLNVNGPVAEALKGLFSIVSGHANP